MANESKPESIFFAALEIPSAEERAAFLDDACGEDHALRHRIDRLLAAEPRVGTFLESPIVDLSNACDSARSSEKPGAVIGPYKLLQEIGEGGFGIVYMAEQLKPIRRHVALKIVKPGMDTREVIARFEAERQALAMMDHSNIARVFDAGTTDSGRPYFVMELVKGVPITEFCDKNNFDTERRLKLFMTVCRAVQHAHQKGVIHRDLKPSNILITLHDGDPVPKVIDFGVAKAISQRLTEMTMFTRYGQMIGTPQYMSPEQAEMSGLDVDTRSDIYSLGVLLYELLTGTTPLDAERIRTAAHNDMLKMIQVEEPLKPSTRISTLGDSLTVVCAHRQTDEKTLRKSVRGDLDWIVMKALEKHRDRRYETATEFARDIQRHLDQEPVVAGPPSAIYLLSKLARRNRVACITAAAVLSALVIGLALALWGFMSANYHRGLAENGLSRAEVAERDAIAQRDEARKANGAAETARREATERSNELAHRVYVMQLATIDHSLSENNFLRAQRQLSDCPEDQRSWEWQFLKDRYAAAVPIQLPSCEQPLFTRDGTQIVAVNGSYNSDESKQVIVWDLASKTPQKKLSFENKLQCVAMSADEKWVVAGAESGHVVLWDLEKGTRQWAVFALQADSIDRFGGISFSQDGSLIAANSWDGHLRVLNRSDGSRKFDFELGGNLRKVSFSPDGRWLATGGVIVDVSSGMIVEEFTTEAAVPTFSPDGRLIATGSAVERKIHLWDWDGEKLSHKTSWKASNSNRFGDLRYCHDGAYLVSAQGAFLAVWDLNSRKKIASLDSPLGMVWSLGVDPKSDAIGFGTSDGLGIWHYTGNDERITVPPLEQPVRLLKFSSNGEKIAMGSHRGQHGVSAADGDIAGKITIIESATGEHIRTIDGNFNGFCWIPESPNLVVTRDEDHTHAMYNVDTGEHVLDFTGNFAIGRPHVDSTGKVLTSIGKDFTVRTWDVNSGQVIDQFSLGHIEGSGNIKAPIGGLWNATVGPLGHYVAVGQGGDIRIWDTRTNAEVVPRLPNIERTTDTLAFNKHGDRLIAIVGNDRFTLFDIATKQVLRGFSGPFGAVAMSPDEKNMVSCGDRLVIWDVESGLPLITLADAVDGGFVAVDWSPDHQRIAAARNDGTVHIWKLPTSP